MSVTQNIPEHNASAHIKQRMTFSYIATEWLVHSEMVEGCWESLKDNWWVPLAVGGLSIFIFFALRLILLMGLLLKKNMHLNSKEPFDLWYVCVRSILGWITIRKQSCSSLCNILCVCVCAVALSSVVMNIFYNEINWFFFYCNNQMFFFICLVVFFV